MRGFSPRCLWVSRQEAALLGELKPGPTRHARQIGPFLSNLNTLLGEAVLQAEAQAHCLFSSWRFGTKDEVHLLAGAGDHSRYAESPGDLKAAAKQFDDMVEDGDWTEGQEEEMYGHPGSAKDQQKRLNEQRRGRDKRAEKRAEHTEQFANALNAPPSADRTTPLFSHAALNELHRLQEKEDFFELEDPEKIQGLIRTVEERETERRNNVVFIAKPETSRTTAKATTEGKAKAGSKDESEADPKATRNKDKKRT
ncbi:hypothetical protein DFH08DRAFT_812522 [Mycena albidolilacea]|uniref:Uncharacterized protein n=1 Tax=Mycena albidolilacea TaxID=1033008 RepID=A0AAD6ZTJ9_9AGAR|nr:hypothetical protein DFH08DRAFT_812522 [Mycena albidolilacea]